MALTQIKSSNIADGTVVAADIADDSITNADIKSDAAIATTKLSGALTSITSHGLGTAAALTVGTAATNIPQLDGGGKILNSVLNIGTSATNILQLDGAAKIPAVDGSQITNTIYDVAFTAGFDKDMVAEDVAANAVYGELVMARAGTFTGEAGYVDTAPVGSVLQVDVFKNGVTIYATTKPQFAAGATALTAGVITVTTFAVNDRITFKVILKGSSTAGKGLRFTLKCKV